MDYGVLLTGGIPFFCFMGVIMQKLIIDVSEHQGVFPWEAVKAHIDGAIIRCGYGDDIKSQDDKQWTRNVAECERLGISYGVYIYSYANTMAHAKSEVAHVKRLLKGHKPQYPVYFDTENPGCESLSLEASTYFCDELTKAGYVAGVYTYASWYTAHLRGLSTKYTLWIADFGVNDGKPHTKPNIGREYDAWQYTSMGKISGYAGRLDVSYFYKTWTNSKPAAASQVVHLGDIAAAIHADMCNDNDNGYSWEPRWGEDGKGAKTITIDGQKFSYDRGSYDCSSSCIAAWKAALAHTKHANALDGATYTGNMRSVFVGSGLFEWKPMSFLAEPGDLYLNEANHVAMCQTQYPDVLSEFSINENGGTYGGKVGDQTGREAYVHDYYDYPWDGILHYNGKADYTVAESKPAESSTSSSSTTTASKKLVVDGIMGPLTIKALQKQLGVKQSGKMDKTTVKALQRALNAGKTMR